MNQLHTHSIANQDLKPSNVLFFEAFGAKVGDLGCADNSTEPAQRPKKLDAKKKEIARSLYAAKSSVKDICGTLGISKATLYRCLPADAAEVSAA